LPDDIVVFHSAELDDDFDARRSALNRCYRYEIYNNRFPSPFHKRFCHHIGDKLDIHAMREAAWEFIGEHDFRAYCASDSSYNTFTREMISLEVFQEGDFIKIDLMANAFLRKMVRTICGTLVEVGREKLSSADVARIIEEGDRGSTGTTLPARGLTLLGAEYPQKYMTLLDHEPCPCRNTNSHYIEL
jgi:tRNA pseudouridine38-40 synthase